MLLLALAALALLLRQRKLVLGVGLDGLLAGEVRQHRVLERRLGSLVVLGEVVHQALLLALLLVLAHQVHEAAAARRGLVVGCGGIVGGGRSSGRGGDALAELGLPVVVAALLVASLLLGRHFGWFLWSDLGPGGVKL